MSEPFLGEMRMVGFNFAPRNWALCDGQILPINQYQALFSLLGTTYGGDGRTTFALPDLRSRSPMHEGRGAGLSDRRLGSKGGTETETLQTSQIPAHTHERIVTNDKGTEKQPNSNLVYAMADDGERNFGSSGDLFMDPVANAGGGQDHNNMQPYTTVNWIIALTGLFPSRN